jgi:hypothetical protein
MTLGSLLFFTTGSYYVAQADLEDKTCCLSLLHAGITSIHYHIQLTYLCFFFFRGTTGICTHSLGLVGQCFTTFLMPPAPFNFVILGIESFEFLPGPAILLFMLPE